MLRRNQDFVGRSQLYDPPGVKNKNAIGKPREQGRVVRNEEHGQPQALSEGAKNLQDFHLCCGIEGCSGFIRNHKRRPAGNRLRDKDALTLASAELMRITARDTPRPLRKHCFENLARFLI